MQALRFHVTFYFSRGGTIETKIENAAAEVIARRKMALENIRKLNLYRSVAEPVEWQREIREGRPLLGRE